MDLRIDNFSFKGLHTNKSNSTIRRISLLTTLMGLSLAASALIINVTKDSFNKKADYVTIAKNQNPQAKAEIIETLGKTKFFAQKDNEIIASILTSMDIESLGCINDENNMEAFGECNSILYKFYVRKSDDNVYYGLVDKLVPGKAPDFKDDPNNPNRSFAFVLKDIPGKKSGSYKQVAFTELAHQNDQYCNDFMFGNGIYDETNDINTFMSNLLDKNTKNVIYTLEK